MQDLAIVIVNYNVRDLVVRNLQSIFKYTEDLDYKVYVIDNGSSDNSIEALKIYFRKEIDDELLEIYDTKTNNGFSKGNNIPFDAINSKYILYMNPDMEIMDNNLKKQVDFMNNNPDIDFSTCKLMYPDNNIQHNIKNLPTFSVNLAVLLKLHHFLKTKSLKKYFLLDFDYNKTQQVEQIMGAYVFAKTDSMEKIGLWNEDYWLWWEDVDLCKRIKDNGMKILYNSDNSLVHYEGESFFQLASVDRQKRFNNGMLIYSKKYFKKYQYFILKIFSYISIFLAFISQVFKIKPRGQGRI